MFVFSFAITCVLASVFSLFVELVYNNKQEITKIMQS